MLNTRIVLDDAKLRGLEKNGRGAMSRVLRSAALACQSSARKRAAVDTGFLKNSIQAQTENAERGETRVIVGAEYGLFVERGTVNQSAQPFIEPAVAEVSLELANMANQSFRESVRHL